MNIPDILDLAYASPNFLPAQSVLDGFRDVVMNKSNPDSYELHQYDYVIVFEKTFCRNPNL